MSGTSPQLAARVAILAASIAIGAPSAPVGALAQSLSEWKKTTCATGSYRFDLGVPRVDSHWRVERDAACAGRIGGRTMSFDSVAVVQRPAHGVAGVYSNYRYAYKPDKGFVGPDHFAILIKFFKNGVHDQTRVDFAIDVVDKL